MLHDNIKNSGLDQAYEEMIFSRILNYLVKFVGATPNINNSVRTCNAWKVGNLIKYLGIYMRVTCLGIEYTDIWLIGSLLARGASRSSMDGLYYNGHQ